MVNGTYANHRKDVMTNILKDEWHFKGLVMSDWFAGNVTGLTSNFTGNVGRDPESAAKMITAGNNLIEPGNLKEDLQASYDNGTLTEEDIDKSVVAILTQVQKTPSYNHYNYSENPDLNAHAALSRLAASESMVLLKNTTSALPIAAGKKKLLHLEQLKSIPLKAERVAVMLMRPMLKTLLADWLNNLRSMMV